MSIKEVAEHKIQDSTKIQTYLDCPRKYFFKFVLGWTPMSLGWESDNNHLEFGGAWHEAMEHLLKHGYDEDSVGDAYEKFLDYYRQTFPPETDHKMKYKTPENALRALEQYVKVYKDDLKEHEVLYTEIGGSVPISDSRSVCMRIDAIMREKKTGEVWVLEHKTGSIYNRVWRDQWKQKTQMFVYLYALYMHFPVETVSGLVVNGVFFRALPKYNKDGTRSARSGNGNEFHRENFRKQPVMIDDFLWTINDIFADIERDFNSVNSDKMKEQKCLKAFRRNTESCTKYFGCPFSSICSAHPNPLQIGMPYGFEEKHWNPLKDIPIKTNITDIKK